MSGGRPIPGKGSSHSDSYTGDDALKLIGEGGGHGSLFPVPGWATHSPPSVAVCNTLCVCVYVYIHVYVCVGCILAQLCCCLCEYLSIYFVCVCAVGCGCVHVCVSIHVYIYTHVCAWMTVCV